jgi:hypothetical protein
LCVADDRPTTQREYAEWLSARLGVPLPPSVPTLAPGAPRRPVRNRRVSNARLKQVLGYALRYPSYVEGELAIEAEAAAAAAPGAAAAVAEARAPIAAPALPPAAAVAEARAPAVAPTPAPSRLAAEEVELRWWRAFDEELALGSSAALARAETVVAVVEEQRARLGVALTGRDLAAARARLAQAKERSR